MGQIGTVFKRYEKKFRLSKEQYLSFRQRIEGHLAVDQYGLSTICNIYYDTQDYELIRKSVESPAFKEKLRLRSYGVPREGDMVFLELKKKYQGIVYKRRIVLPLEEAVKGLENGKIEGQEGQIVKEINYFLARNLLMPKVYLAYDRIAMLGMEQPDLRVTFDFDIRAREDDLALTEGDGGEHILHDDDVIMEIKVKDAFPLWMVRILEEGKILPASFSKYGTYFKQNILEREREKRNVS